MVADATIRKISLVVLAVQNVVHTVALRESRLHAKDSYLTSSVVVVTEIVKLLLSSIVLFRDGKLLATIKEIRHEPFEMLQTAVPAVVYIGQNHLLFFAFSHLDTAFFQVTYQIKLLTTAMFSVIFLNRRINLMQWLSLFVLFCGVAIVQVSEQTSTSSDQAKSNTTVGVIAVVCASLLSGFAAVYFEMILKNSKKSLWSRNFQLAFISIIVGSLGQAFTQSSQIASGGYFRGFNWLVWFIIGLQSGGGLVVALVVKYADNIIKGFACSTSIIMSCIVSVAFYNVKLSNSFILGATLVVVSVVLYSIYGKQRQQEKKAS